MKYFSLPILLVFSLFFHCDAQVNNWFASSGDQYASLSADEKLADVEKYHAIQLDFNSLRSELQNVPHEHATDMRRSNFVFQFPMADGSIRNFQLVEYAIAQKGLSRKFPWMKAYRGTDLDYGSTIRFNMTKSQFYGVIQENGKTYYIDPIALHDVKNYIVYNIANAKNHHGEFQCDAHDMAENIISTNEEQLDSPTENIAQVRSRGEALTLRTYRLAVSTTSGFTNYYGGTVAGAMEGVTIIVNRINSVLEREVAIRLILIDNNDELIVTDPNADPFEDGNLGQMINQNQATIDGIIGSQNYDIGHVFGSAFLQGLAQLGAVCGQSKARGGSVFNPPVGDPFVVSIICHEMGHQFNAAHTMYHCHNVNTPTGYEPGSGSTIMSYAGICNPYNVQGDADDYYHVNSLESIINFSRNLGGASCGQDIDLGNSYPTIELDYPNLIRLPINTPFRLTGRATDMESPETMTYGWEQYQAGTRDFSDVSWDITQPVGNEPLFRSLPPSDNPTRYFPALFRVVNNLSYIYEQLPTYERDLKFRFVVRDNAPENGGSVWEEIRMRAFDNSDSGRFEVTSFNTLTTINSGDYVEVTWNVAATNQPPINTKTVDIFLSTDGGESFPIVLKENTKNDGSTFVNIPDVEADEFRIMVAASNSVYFNISKSDGIIEAPTTAGVGVSYADECYQICMPDVREFDISTFGVGGYDGELDFDIISTLPAGTSVSFSSPTIMSGETTTLIFDAISGTETGSFDLTFQISGDGFDPIERTIEIITVYNDFSAMSLDLPVDGAIGVSTVPSLAWTGVDHAASYTVELSDDPSFQNIIFERSGLTVTEIDIDVQLEGGKVYFWRVKPTNACGSQDLNRVAAFQVQTVSCEEFCSTQASIPLSTTGTPTAEMTINTGSPIGITDFNVTSIEGFHSDMGDVKFTLKGPDNTSIDMFGPNTCRDQNANILMGFDDQAAISIPNCINFGDGLRFVPTNPLSVLNGLSGSSFTLVMKDVQSGDGGRLDKWCFEICGNIAPELPMLITADTIHLNSFEKKTIGSNKLEVSHSNYDASDLTITIVEVPDHGELQLNNQAITVGDTFTMADVQANRLAYQNNSNDYENDHFSFIVTDPNGGFLGTPSIDFVIGLSSTNNTLPPATSLSIYPNPAHDAIFLEWSSEYTLDRYTVFDAQGKRIAISPSNLGDRHMIDVSNWNSGVYIIQLQSDAYVFSRKIVVN